MSIVCVCVCAHARQGRPCTRRACTHADDTERCALRRFVPACARRPKLLVHVGPHSPRGYLRHEAGRAHVLPRRQRGRGLVERDELSRAPGRRPGGPRKHLGAAPGRDTQTITQLLGEKSPAAGSDRTLALARVPAVQLMADVRALTVGAHAAPVHALVGCAALLRDASRRSFSWGARRCAGRALRPPQCRRDSGWHEICRARVIVHPSPPTACRWTTSAATGTAAPAASSPPLRGPNSWTA